MSDMSFLTAVKTKSFLHMVITFISGELAILLEMEFLGLSLEGPLEGLEDDDDEL